MKNKNIARTLGVTPEQVAKQFARNAKQLRAMEAQARETGRKQGGFTAEELSELARKTDVTVTK